MCRICVLYDVYVCVVCVYMCVVRRVVSRIDLLWGGSKKAPTTRRRGAA
jgi:hypothetical protein